MSDVAVAGIRARSIAPIAATGTASRQILAAEVLQGAEAYEALLPEWKRLAELQPGTSLFQTPSLLSTWAQHFACGRAARLTTVVLRHAGQPVLIWPLFIERRALVRIARGAGVPISQYDEILVDPAFDKKAAFAAALDALRDTVRPDLVLLEGVRADSALRAALRDVSPIGCGDAAPNIDLSQGLAVALAMRKPYAAKQQRKRMKRFIKAGKSTVAIANDPAEAEAWLVEALTLKRNWLRSTGRLSRAFVKAETGNCLAGLARALSHPSASPRMVVAKLSLDGRTAAIEVGFVHRGAFQLYLRAFAPEFASLGPGNVLTERMLEWCAENRIEIYDMLAPRSRNKAEWQSGEVGVEDFALPMTWRGRLYAATVPTLLAPTLRDAFYALPERLRSVIAGMALRM